MSLFAPHQQNNSTQNAKIVLRVAECQWCYSWYFRETSIIGKRVLQFQYWRRIYFISLIFLSGGIFGWFWLWLTDVCVFAVSISNEMLRQRSNFNASELNTKTITGNSSLKLLLNIKWIVNMAYVVEAAARTVTWCRWCCVSNSGFQ